MKFDLIDTGKKQSTDYVGVFADIYVCICTPTALNLSAWKQRVSREKIQ